MCPVDVCTLIVSEIVALIAKFLLQLEEAGRWHEKKIIAIRIACSSSGMICRSKFFAEKTGPVFVHFTVKNESEESPTDGSGYVRPNLTIY
jgi:hypothetical protein